MSADEIIKHIPELAAAAKVAVAAVPFTAVVKRMLGPAVDEVSEILRDKVRLYRYSQQIKCLEKAEKMAKEAGFTPQPVPPKILFPLLEGVSFEEDEDLHTMWAALLANASTGSTADLVRPSFCEVLRLMTPDVARLLNLAFDHAWEKAHPPPKTSRQTPDIDQEDRPPKKPSLIDEIIAVTHVDLGTYRHVYRQVSAAVSKEVTIQESDETDGDKDTRDHWFAVAMDELDRMRMWSTTHRESGDHYYLSALAAQFVLVCRQPAPQHH
jgi:hypothetical protein